MLLFTVSWDIPPLNYIDLTVINNTECADLYGDIITDTKICTGTPNGQSACYVSFSFRYSSEIHFFLFTTQNLLPPTRPPVQ